MRKTGKLRLCVDYRHLNSITVKNRYPLPLITELQDKLKDAQWFTAIDLLDGYNLIRIKEGEEWKTAFRTRLGHFEYSVMPFGLTNAPATFQRMIDTVLRQFLDEFVVVYLDDILIFSKTFDQHQRHVHLVLQALERAKLLVNAEKSIFHVQEIDYLGHTITPGNVRMQQKKVATIIDWPTPTNLREVRSFLGFTNYYRKFIQEFGTIAMPLTALTKKDTPFTWTEKEEQAFTTLKKKVTEQPVLIMPDPSKPFEVETDASDFAIGGVLSQRDEQSKLHPVAFFSKKFHGPELNYPIHDKELMAIIEAFKEWKHYLSGTTHEVKVYTDHKNLTYFTTTKELNQRQTRWSEFLSEFNFRIIYRKGSENDRADALSRRTDHEQTTEPSHRIQAVLKEDQDGTLRNAVLKDDEDFSTRTIQTTLRIGTSEELTKRFQDWADDENRPEETTQDGDILVYREKPYLPTKHRRTTIQELHDERSHGHQGITKTYHRLSQYFKYPGMKKDIEQMIKSCTTCSRTKASSHKPYGLLKPLQAPTKPWESITMDFIVKLPPSKAPGLTTTFDTILVIVDRLTKYAYFLPYMETMKTTTLAYVVHKEVLSQHGLPNEFITDRGTTFTSNFWKALTQQLGIKHKLSTAFHPQTDGQTERTNRTLEQYLRAYVNYPQNNWVELLPSAQFAYNSAQHESTKKTPFYANYGYEPTIHQQALGTTQNPAGRLRADQLKDLHEELTKELEFVRHRMKRHYDKSRMSEPPLEEGDKTFLIRRNIKTKRPSDKLDFKKLGPFIVKRKISDTNYELSLPEGMKIHPVFHISLLEPAPANSELQDQVEVEDEPEFEVEAILAERQQGQQTEYLVKWKGYDHAENTWEPTEHLTNSSQALEEYRRKEPSQAHRRKKRQTKTRTATS